MGILDATFYVVAGDVDPRDRGIAVLEELLVMSAPAPLAFIDFETVHLQWLHVQMCRRRVVVPARQWVLLRRAGASGISCRDSREPLGERSGARRGLSLLGVTPALHLISEVNEEASRVSAANYPDAVQLGDVTRVPRRCCRRRRQKLRISHTCCTPTALLAKT